MSFRERLKALAQRIPTLIDHLQTEEATKNALIMPFISALGYDVFNPLEVVPEFTADVGIKKGEKVDYAVKQGNQVILIFEAKKANIDLSKEHASQLHRYFSVTHARIAALTNGIHYLFYSDLDEPNKMDKDPFLELNLLNIKDNLVTQLQSITKESFDLDGMLNAANDLKYMRGLRITFESQFDEPDEDLVRFFFSKASPSARFTQSMREQFTRLVKQTLQQVVSDRVSERLRLALAHESVGDTESPSEAEKSESEGDTDKEGIETTEEELEGYRVVQAILAQSMPPERIFYRDTKSYFGIIVDNNNRRPICRLHLNRSKKYLGLFDDKKNEAKHLIEQVSDLYKFADDLRAAASRYLQSDSVNSPE